MIGIVLATVLGTLIGLARLSRNFLLRNLSAAYVEFVRNVPLLVQLFFWYAVITEGMPPRAKRFRRCPGCSCPTAASSSPRFERARAAGLQFRRRRGAERRSSRRCWSASPSIPRRSSPRSCAPASWRSTAGRSRPRTRSACRAPQTTRHVILPQALRVIVPPMTSQYLNLTKNSSLAVAIGYPDLVSIANTTMNQTGQAIEGIAIIMAVYLTISLSISAFMNWYNARIALR